MIKPLVAGMVVWLVGSGCSEGNIESCKTRYSVNKGFKVEGDLPMTTKASNTPPGTAQQTSSPPVLSDLDQAVASCQSGGGLVGHSGSDAAIASEPGVDCDPNRIMTRDAAVCIARAEGLTEGIIGLQAGLVYNVGVRRIIWVVRNTTSSNTDGNGAHGQQLSIDAITGAVLERSEWAMMP
jgi:hypothetical protein